jgi:hypothetical protein
MKGRFLKFTKIIAGIFLLLCGVAAVIIVQSELDEAVIKEYTKNEALLTIKPDWQGTPADEKGRFVNHEFPFLPRVTDMLKWQLGARPFKEAKQADTERLAVKDPTGFLNSNADGILWFGHASFLIRLDGVNILVDPVFGEPSFITRLVSPASPLNQLQKVDYILISHDHRDHCDETTIKELTTKFPNVKILAGLRMNELLDDWKNQNVETQTVSVDYSAFSVSYARVGPARRMLLERRRRTRDAGRSRSSSKMGKREVVARKPTPG